MKTYILLFVLLTAGFLNPACSMQDRGGTVDAIDKPKLIICTDIGGDPDDTQSLTRLLLYANEFDILGFIASASGTRGELKVDTVQPQLILDHIDAYAKVLPNLQKHDPDFPDATILKSRVKSGNPQRGLDYIGAGHDTEGSDWIISQVDDADQEMINIAVWGGQTDLVQALWRVKQDRDYESYLDFVSKIRIYDINDQDGIYTYIKSEFPELFYILAKAPEGVDKREGAYRGMYLGGEESTTSLEWINENLRFNHGPLGALYPPKTWTAPNPHGALKEGDSPSWFYFLQNGLQDAGHPSYGGWGGRFEAAENNYFRDGEDFAGEDINARATVYRWRSYFQHDFQARMDWCVSDPKDVNHAPKVVVNGDASKEVYTVLVQEGGQVTINTIGTEDPDGDELSYAWWIYPEAGTARQCPEMWPIDEPDVPLEIPIGEAGREMHLICEVTDNGSPALTSFRRIVLKITE